MMVLILVGFVVLLGPSLVILAAGLNRDKFLKFPPSGLTLHWLDKFMSGPLLTSFAFSFGLALLASCVATILGTLAALSVTRGVLRRFPASRALFMAPLTVPGVILGFALYIFYVGSGIGLARTYVGLLTGHVIVVMPYIIGSVSAALAGVNPRLRPRRAASARVRGGPFGLLPCR
jgi:putative spermidine/putrescine transport system permease protein